jgi:hypothetical protein
MATKVECDLCGAEGAKTSTYEKRVALPKPVNGANTARVHIHIFAENKRQELIELCDPCREKLAATAAYVPPPPATAPEKPAATSAAPAKKTP